MGIMDKMMDMMISRMSKEEKEDMMLKMMPKMMEGVDMAEVMPQMMSGMMKNISLDDVFNILKKLFPEILKGVTSLSEAIPKLMDALPKFMEKMMPAMMKMMGKDNVDGGMLMPNMMMKMMPHCLDAMFPYMPKEKRIDFAVNMVDSLVSKEGCAGISKEEKEELRAEIAKKIKA